MVFSEKIGATMVEFLMAPAGTPPDIIARLNREVNQALKSSDVLERFASQGTEALGGTPEQAASYVRQ
jgi:tripartite-type tricarboxylate transporter receptor subunit TctC